MKKRGTVFQTTVGGVDHAVLAFTAAEDASLDLALVEAECLGSAAHAIMLSRMRPPIITASERTRVLRALRAIREAARAGQFVIRLEDQDVHLAVERHLTERLGDLGRKIHTARSRNDQVATDLRLYARTRLLSIMEAATDLAAVLTRLAGRYERTPMAGRTHMQPAMPSSVGLWAGAHAESLLDDLALLVNAYELNDQCPLGSAASYGVPLKIDRQLTSELLGFSRPIHNVLYANNARGKTEAAILSALGQVMITLSRLAQDLILFSMPEFSYFGFPPEYGTGSSIMPQKNNPDVLELVRARAARVLGLAATAAEIARAMPSGYNRDWQELKRLLLDGLGVTEASLRIMARLVSGLTVNRSALRKGFSAGVFATDKALEMAAAGVPFREAYRRVKAGLDELNEEDPAAAVARKTHYGAPAGMDLEEVRRRVRAAREYAREERGRETRMVARLLG